MNGWLGVLSSISDKMFVLLSVYILLSILTSAIVIKSRRMQQ